MKDTGNVHKQKPTFKNAHHILPWHDGVVTTIPVNEQMPVRTEDIHDDQNQSDPGHRIHVTRSARANIHPPWQSQWTSDSSQWSKLDLQNYK